MSSELFLDLEAEEDDGKDGGDDDGDAGCEALDNVVRVLDDDGDQQSSESLVEDHRQGDAVEAEENSLKQFLAREIRKHPRNPF